MKSRLITKTLGVIAMATIGIAPGVQANDWDDDDNRDYGYSERENDRDANLMQKLRDGARYSKLVNDRQAQQLDRIMASVEADRLSKSRFLRLMQEQKGIRAMESRFLDDQFLTEREFQRLNQSLDVAQRNIQLAHRSNEHRRYSYSQRAWIPN